MTAPEHVTLNESGTMVVCSHFNVWPSDVEYTRADLCIRRDDPALLAVVEALKWYESAACDCRKITREGDDARHALHADGGKRASTAIAAITERMGRK
ncbi:hypothetical protein [Paenirhodobacter sp. CAU 1674]|uniref:hypothetical protein n=1 Tax=Paenirhodobacter sp. CAU 1674 TaxID=3032596 RepID=UPI0023DB1810|nr:hypothetical protein [Paenirhodobacter sp. CAU 1674]MDF2140819.1 hypothetical protein [Paenirhodobacter sp. CAU 1674]